MATEEGKEKENKSEEDSVDEELARVTANLATKRKPLNDESQRTISALLEQSRRTHRGLMQPASESEAARGDVSACGEETQAEEDVSKNLICPGPQIPLFLDYFPQILVAARVSRWLSLPFLPPGGRQGAFPRNRFIRHASGLVMSQGMVWCGCGAGGGKSIKMSQIPARCRRSSMNCCGGCGIAVCVLPALTGRRATLDRINLGRARHASFASAERAKQNRKSSKFTWMTR